MRAPYVAVAVILVAVAGACADVADPGVTDASASSTTYATTTYATVAPATTSVPTSPPDPRGAEALAFFRAQESVCAAHAAGTGNPSVPSSWFRAATVAAVRPDGTVLVVDGAGNSFVVDAAQGVVHDPAGPQEVLPREYSFGCPETVFLGTAED